MVPGEARIVARPGTDTPGHCGQAGLPDATGGRGKALPRGAEETDWR